MARLNQSERESLLWHWPFWARPNQMPPDGDWNTWVVLAGRGFGKTRAGSEWVRHQVKSGKRRIALIAETQRDLEQVIVDGDSGIMAVCPPNERPTITKRPVKMVFPNGAIALGYNGTEPDQLRGPQFDAAWCDELAKWRYARETWDMLQFGLRLGEHPRCMITTTPRPIELLKDIMRDQKTVVTRGSTFENSSNLAATFLAAIRKKYEGTRLGRQELAAEILDDVPGSLWTREGLDKTRRNKTDKLPDMQRVVVAIDPAGKSQEAAVSDGTAETGIIVAGLGVDGRGYVIADETCALSPNGWARRAVSCYDMYAADAIVAETNQGGEMIKSVIKSVRDVPVIEVTASRGKVTRAEPIAALYEQGRISHVGAFADLEDQMVLFTPLGIAGDTTGDRVDALVWALAQLFPSLVRKDVTDWTDAFTGAGRSSGAWMGA